jgi:Leucine-rich repeat (LRR) protein
LPTPIHATTPGGASTATATAAWSASTSTVHGCGLGGWVPGNDDANASSLARLRELDLGDNNLGGPLPVLALPQLQRLNLRGNAFKTIPELFFLHMKQLEHFFRPKTSFGPAYIESITESYAGGYQLTEFRYCAKEPHKRC